MGEQEQTGNSEVVGTTDQLTALADRLFVLDQDAVWMPASDLHRWKDNPRVNEAAVPKVKESLLRHGFVAPIVVDRSRDRMVAGHTRLAASEQLFADPSFAFKNRPHGWVRVLFHDFASEEEAIAYALADNRLGEIAEWDDAKLAQQAKRLNDIDRSLLQSAGFEDREVRSLLAKAAKAERAPLNEDEVPPTPAVPTSKLGDVWILGEHRLICGDSTNPETFARLMGDDRADLFWSDPPYNVAYEAANGQTIQNDSMSDEKFRAFLSDAFRAVDTVLRAGAAFYITHPDVETYNFLAACRAAEWKLSQILIWEKDRFVLSRKDYHSRHEPMLYGWKPGAAHNFVADRTQDTLWKVARPTKNEEHPTMKPVELIERSIINSTQHLDVVLDAFGGSGSTLIACEKTGRQARLVELEPKYCDVIVKRWEQLTERKAERRC